MFRCGNEPSLIHSNNDGPLDDFQPGALLPTVLQGTF